MADTTNPTDDGADGEFDLIRRHFKPLTRGHPGALGLIDDAALLDVEAGCQMVVTTDALIAGVHFLESLSPQDIAHKVVGVNLSDLAAMGAKPRAVFLAAQLTDAVDEAWLAAFAKGFAQALDGTGAALMGGDLVATPGPLAFTLTAIGDVGVGRALTRAGAKDGDALFVTGTIGDGALGLLAATGEIDQDDALIARYARPTPRNAFAHLLAKAGFAHACIDISDGLVADVGHLCEASRLAATIDLDAVPLSDAAKRAVAERPALLETVLGGGDDYELAFAADPADAELIDEVGQDAGVRVTRIGTFARGDAGVEVLDADGQAVALTRAGYRHR